MYIPPSFVVTDPAQLHDFMQQYSFATLISQAGNEPLASHLPLLLDRNAAPHGRLIGHFARANSHWQSAAGQRVLVIFHGPHTYVSPGWIESQNVVPTWNYVAVHAYGTLRLIEDRDRLRELLQRTVTLYESNREQPRSMAAPPRRSSSRSCPPRLPGLRSMSVGSEGNGSSTKTIRPNAASRSCAACARPAGTTNCGSPN